MFWLLSVRSPVFFTALIVYYAFALVAVVDEADILNKPPLLSPASMVITRTVTKRTKG